MFIAEIDPSQIAVVSGLVSTPAILQLVAGGDAVLSVPSAPLITGKVLRLLLSGRASSTGGKTTTVSAYLGDSTVAPIQIGFSTTSSGNFSCEYDFAYDSVTQNFIQPTNPQKASGASPVSLANQTDIQFVIAANTNVSSDPGATVTITSFRIEIT